MNFQETETVEYKKTTGEIKEAAISIVAMLNKHQKAKIVFGIDPKGRVVKNEISESSLRNVSRRIYEAIEPRIYPIVEQKKINNVNVIEVSVSGNEVPYSAFGRYYIRTADEDRELGAKELKRLLVRNQDGRTWEEQLTKYTINDVDLDALKEFYNLSIESGRILDLEFEPKKILSRLGVLYEDKLTNAGYMMFSNRKPMTLKLAIFATDEKLTFLDIKTIEDNIFNLIKVAQTYIEKNIRWSAEIVDFVRIEVPEIPVGALREIIVNSFAHSQYMSSSNHEIRIHPNKIVIYSPGEFDSDYSPNDYIESDLPSIVRNKTIANILYLFKAIEQFGSGFKRVHALCADEKIKYSYQMLNEGFEFTFYRNNIITNNQNNVVLKTDVDVSEEAKMILNLLNDNPKYTREELSQIMSKSVRTIQRYLNELTEKKIIIRSGGKQLGFWEINKK